MACATYFRSRMMQFAALLPLLLLTRIRLQLSVIITATTSARAHKHTRYKLCHLCPY
jgi:hypothetical protein